MVVARSLEVQHPRERTGLGAILVGRENREAAWGQSAHLNRA